MHVTLPFLTAYDPPGASEGTLDPLGLYQIADQLGSQLVPAVRERMLRVRFLTAMAVGSMVTEGLEDDPTRRDASPYLVWEWLVVEGLIREAADGLQIWGVPGTQVARRALEQHGYLDARSYLKTPRIFGFHGVYKRLAVHLGIVDVHLSAGPNAEVLVDAWARGLGLGGVEGAKPLLSRWSAAVRRSLGENPPRTRTGWSGDAWTELAKAFAPSAARVVEKRCLRDMLHGTQDRHAGALPTLWSLQGGFQDEDFREEDLHNRLEEREPGYGSLLTAIRAYEAFARSLQDGFDVLKAEATRSDVLGYHVPSIGRDPDFSRSMHGLHERFEAAHRALGELTVTSLSLPNLFGRRFVAFGEPMDAGASALALCSHHEAVQRAKSAQGKRAWFDRLASDRIYIRHAYREARRDTAPGRYLHDYRGWPIRRFWHDLS